MARTTLATQALLATGVVPTYGAANALGHSVDPDAVLLVKNGGGAPITVTLQTPQVDAGLAVAEQAVVIANGTEQVIHIPRSEQSVYVRPAGAADPGTVYIDFSGVTSVTIGAFKL